MILVLGTPGAGKTTQAGRLAGYLNCPWFSMGELIRQKVTGKDRAQMLAGKIISDEVTLKIVDQALNSIDTHQECIYEGNPRSVSQAEWWQEQAKAGRFKIRAVLHLVATPAVAEKRLVNRGRLDDHDDNVVETRFAEYRRSITPTLEYLKSQGVPVLEVDANGTIEEDAARVRQALGV